MRSPPQREACGSRRIAKAAIEAAAAVDENASFGIEEGEVDELERKWIGEAESEARVMLELQYSPHVTGMYAAGWYKSRDAVRSEHCPYSLCPLRASERRLGGFALQLAVGQPCLGDGDAMESGAAQDISMAAHTK